jgi:VIT1/CCC1 family predicted Fe2+/Mn2+ transporter
MSKSQEEQDLLKTVLSTPEFEKNKMAARLNWLRAGVLGANDGIMSTSGLILGVAGATTDTKAILIAGVAAVVAGSISMAGGEYTSVSAQRDSEKASLETERIELRDNPEGELLELQWFYEQKGMSPELARQVAEELTAKDALRAHAEAELGIDPEHHASPAQAAISSLIAFACGGLLPLFASMAQPSFRLYLIIAAVIVALTLTGYIGAKIGGAKPGRGILRNLSVSLMTMGITYLVGYLFGTHVVA